mmetsp:Transcript_27852/g.39182  ORF Transcript_27852/g.39182 Transcript_27852/m.39182 type:complete len:191 (+) Transcript_27852:45-617(+)
MCVCHSFTQLLLCSFEAQCDVCRYNLKKRIMFGECTYAFFPSHPKRCCLTATQHDDETSLIYCFLQRRVLSRTLPEYHRNNNNNNNNNVLETNMVAVVKVECHETNNPLLDIRLLIMDNDSESTTEKKKTSCPYTQNRKMFGQKILLGGGGASKGKRGYMCGPYVQMHHPKQHHNPPPKKIVRLLRVYMF